MEAIITFLGVVAMLTMFTLRFRTVQEAAETGLAAPTSTPRRRSPRDPPDRDPGRDHGRRMSRRANSGADLSA
jgi:hypothetical protein